VALLSIAGSTAVVLLCYIFKCAFAFALGFYPHLRSSLLIHVGTCTFRVVHSNPDRLTHTHTQTNTHRHPPCAAYRKPDGITIKSWSSGFHHRSRAFGRLECFFRGFPPTTRLCTNFSHLSQYLCITRSQATKCTVSNHQP
jgi:hypothetical protein